MAKMKKLGNDSTAYFCEQLWLMVNTGMQLSDGLEILEEDIDDNNLKNICGFLANKIEDGNSLFTAMKDCGVFPGYAVNMVQIGCVSGRLDDVLKGLADYYEDRAETERTVRYAVFHPSMLLVMMTIVVIVLVVKIIPMFEGIFAQFDSQIGAAVTDTVSIAYTMGQVILVVLLVLIALLALVILIPPIKRAVLDFASVFPLTRRFSRSFAQAKLADAMYMMITSGLDPENALEYSMGLISDKTLTKQLQDCLDRVKNGEYFADAISESRIFPKMYCRSLKIAYSSGSFDEVWRKISIRTGEEAMRTLTNLISFVEPAMIVVLALIIGSVLMTIMLPLMNIMSALG